nr:glycosyltransferase family 4 protein [Marinigracilibium pacificum]
MTEAGYDVYVLCFSFEGKTTKSYDEITVDRISISDKKKNILYFFNVRLPFYRQLWSVNIRRFIEKYELTKLHVHDLYLAMPARDAINKAGKDVMLVVDLHENYPDALVSYNWTKGTLRNFLSNPDKWKEWEFKYLKAADKIVVLSDHYRDQLIEKYPSLNKKSFYVYPNTIDIKRFEEFPVDYNKPRIFSEVTLFYFGVVAERRGVFDAIKATKQANDRGANVRLLIIGPVDNADKIKFNDIITSDTYSSVVKYIPWIDVSELPDYLNISDICLSPIHKNPQHESGIANKIFQYMFGKKPLIVSNSIPQMELVIDNNCGLHYTNQNEFVEAILTLVNNPKLRDDMGMNGYKALVNKYASSQKDMALLDVYND